MDLLSSFGAFIVALGLIYAAWHILIWAFAIIIFIVASPVFIIREILHKEDKDKDATAVDKE